MKLFYNPASPYVRKALVVAHERGLAAQITLQPCAPAPIKPVPELSAENPLGKIPTLVLDDGQVLYDSRVIVEYLDTLASGAPLIPASGAARWKVLRLQADADGLLDAALSVRYERVIRPKELLFPDWVQGQLGKIYRTLDVLEREAAGWNAPLHLGQVAAACALGYLDFRFADENWRDGRPTLTAFFKQFSARPSMVATAPA